MDYDEFFIKRKGIQVSPTGSMVEEYIIVKITIGMIYQQTKE